MTVPVPTPPPQTPVNHRAAHTDTVAIPLSRLAESARRIERAGADCRLCRKHDYKAPGYSAARTRDALLGNLGMLVGRSNTELYDLLHAGQLVEAFGGAVREKHGECAICGRVDVLVIDAKHVPREPEVFTICRSEQACMVPRDDAEPTE